VRETRPGQGIRQGDYSGFRATLKLIGTGPRGSRDLSFEEARETLHDLLGGTRFLVGYAHSPYAERLLGALHRLGSEAAIAVRGNTAKRIRSTLTLAALARWRYIWGVEASASAPVRPVSPAPVGPTLLSRSSDERLAKLIAQGNQQAFATLYERYHQQLYRYCRSIVRDDADAQDALQSTMLSALSALQESRRKAPMRPWLYRIAHNESISVLRRRPSVGDESVETISAVDASAEDRAGERARFALLMADLGHLPARQRSALLMRELSGLSHEEIAVALDTTEGTAKQAIFEARKALAEFEEGRAMECERVRRVISDGDGRQLRRRGLRAHLRECAGCRAFEAAIPRRTAELDAVVPVLAAPAAAALLAKVFAGGKGAVAGAGAAAGGGTAAGGATAAGSGGVGSGAAAGSGATAGSGASAGIGGAAAAGSDSAGSGLLAIGAAKTAASGVLAKIAVGVALLVAGVAGITGVRSLESTSHPQVSLKSGRTVASGAGHVAGAHSAALAVRSARVHRSGRSGSTGAIGAAAAPAAGSAGGPTGSGSAGSVGTKETGGSPITSSSSGSSTGAGQTTTAAAATPSSATTTHAGSTSTSTSTRTASGSTSGGSTHVSRSHGSTVHHATAPGSSGTAPGHTGAAPGKGASSPPGHTGATPGATKGGATASSGAATPKH
jgi:RNA polymerase sigma factor (sigma-70 family)